MIFSLEYRLIPDVRDYEQFDDVCAGMDCVGRKLVDFDVDFTRIYMVAESAGVYLATYNKRHSEYLSGFCKRKTKNVILFTLLG